MPRVRVTIELEVPYGLVERTEAGEDEAIEELEELVLDAVRGGIGEVEFVV